MARWAPIATQTTGANGTGRDRLTATPATAPGVTFAPANPPISVVAYMYTFVLHSAP